MCVLSMHHVIAIHPKMVRDMVKIAKQHPDLSNMNKGKYIRESMVNRGENNNMGNVFLPIMWQMFFIFVGSLKYTHNEMLTVR